MAAKATKFTIPAITDGQYDLLCGALRSLGHTLHSWASERRLPASTTYAAARGLRAGKKTQQIQKQLEDTLNAEKK